MDGDIIMSMMENVAKDLTSAMKEQDKFTLSVLRMLKSALQLEKISKKHDLTDDEVITVVKRQVKTRKDSMSEYEQYNKMEEVENLKKEIEVLSKYLPPELSKEEIEKVLDDIFAEIKPESIKDMGKIMKEATAKLGNAADMSLVSSLVKEKLS
jgi:uncharacterized protein YqeY